MGRLKRAGARTDGLNWDAHGALSFRTTHAHGAWTPEQIAEAKAALGK